MPDHCSIFQAELTAIKLAEDAMFRSTAYFKEVIIHSDSKAAILASSSPTMSSKFVKKCLPSVSIASLYLINILVGIAGNCKADKFAISAGLMHFSAGCVDLA